MMIRACIHVAARTPACVYVFNMKERIGRAAFSSRRPLDLRMRYYRGSCVDSFIKI